MSLSAGARLGSYEIVAPLGVGGMGEVYRARDTKLGREVALKILPDAFAQDHERLARFQREAQVLASLNHQNIAAIYGLEDSSDSTHALVMELVEGPTLAERIDAGAIPLAEALPIAAQIAEALEAAHELGIIHRDLKPANIKLRPDGTVKVLDFGLAKMVEIGAGRAGGPGGEMPANSPTISLAATQAGMILGTASYMAPEQARGRAVDKRADVWAFGVVLYEMLTGARAFPGDDVSDTLATVLKFDPEWSKLPANTPPSIRRLLRRCLTKDPKFRLRDCGSALLDIQEALASPERSESAASLADAKSAPLFRQSAVTATAALLLGAIAGVGGWTMVRGAAEPPQPTRRFTITLPESDVLAQNSGGLLALSPDGRTLVYRATRGTISHLFRRPIDQFEAAVIASAPAGVGEMFFSPDGLWLGFDVDRTLKKLALAGGPPQVLIGHKDPIRGADWSADGRIVFALNVAGGGLMQVPGGGGEATQLFKTDDHRVLWYPQVLPGGKAVLFTSSESRPDSGELHVLMLEGGADKTILPTAAAGRVLPTGHLVFIRSGALWAAPFDLSRLEATGTPVPVVEGVRVESGGAVQYAASDDGTLVYIPGRAATNLERTLMFVGRNGRPEPVSAPPREYSELALSPDQTRVAVQIAESEDADVWVVEIARGTLTRVTTEPGFDGGPLWSNDGKTIVFASSRDGRWALRRKAADGTGEAELLSTFEQGVASVVPYSWSPDGLSILTEVDGDIGLVPANAKGGWKPLIRTSASENKPAVSPDGRLIAYGSTESGTGEVYLQRFPELGDRRNVSSGSGHSPTWSRDGRKLFWLRGGPPNAVMHVTIQANRDGRVEIGKPEVFSEFRFFSRPRTFRTYDVAADSQRLLVINRGSDAEATDSRQINVVTNWLEELKRLVPIGK